MAAGAQQARLLGEEPQSVAKDQEYRPATKNHYWLDEVVSALQKEIRRGNEDSALFWAHELVDSGFSNHMWNRLGVMVSEEIGLADPDAYPRIHAMRQLYEARMKSATKGPHTFEILGAAILYMCRAPKNKEAGMASYSVMMERYNGRRDQVPDYAVDFHTKAGRDQLESNNVSHEEQSILWWMDWAYCANVQAGNKWLRRVFDNDDWISAETRENLYRQYLETYRESDENQTRRPV